MIEVLCLRRDVPAVFVMQANVPLHVEDPEAVDEPIAASTSSCAPCRQRQQAVKVATESLCA